MVDQSPGCFTDGLGYSRLLASQPPGCVADGLDYSSRLPVSQPLLLAFLLLVSVFLVFFCLHVLRSLSFVPGRNGSAGSPGWTPVPPGNRPAVHAQAIPWIQVSRGDETSDRYDFGMISPTAVRDIHAVSTCTWWWISFLVLHSSDEHHFLLYTWCMCYWWYMYTCVL